MHVILIPGFWLQGESWAPITPTLVAAGHHVLTPTLPGKESAAADQAGVGLRTHIDAIVSLVDELTGPVALVGHSGGGADVAQTQNGGAVRDHRDRVALDREFVRFAGVFVDCHADAGDSRRVGNREVVTGLEGNAGLHLHLAAQVGKEHAVGVVEVFHTRNLFERRYDFLTVFDIAS